MYRGMGFMRGFCPTFLSAVAPFRSSSCLIASLACLCPALLRLPEQTLQLFVLVLFHHYTMYCMSRSHIVNSGYLTSTFSLIFSSIGKQAGLSIKDGVGICEHSAGTSEASRDKCNCVGGSSEAVPCKDRGRANLQATSARRWVGTILWPLVGALLGAILYQVDQRQ